MSDQHTSCVTPCPDVSGAGHVPDLPDHVSPSAADLAIITTECTSPLLVMPWPALCLLHMGFMLDNCRICCC